MKYLLGRLALPFVLSACQFVKISHPGDPANGTTSSAATSEGADPAATQQAEADFAAARTQIEQADRALASDPATAEREYLAARGTIVAVVQKRTYSVHYPGGNSEKPGREALWDRDVLPQRRAPGPQMAETLLWNTFLGRTTALRALHRDLEVLGEHPPTQSTGDECPDALRAKCKEHLAWLLATYPGAFAESKGQSAMDRGGVYQTIVVLEQPMDLSLLTERLDEKKGQGPIVLRMRPQTSKTTGTTVTLSAKVGDIAFRTGSDCKQVLKTDHGQVVVQDGKVEVEDRCASVGSSVAKGKTLNVKIDAEDMHGHELASDESKRQNYDLAVDQAALKKSADGRVYTFEKAHVLEVAGGQGTRRWLGVDLAP